MSIGAAEVLITTEAIYKRKISAIRKDLPDLKEVLLIGCKGDAPKGTRDLGALMAAASPEFDVVHTAAEDMALLHFTSGTTGRPKGAVQVHEAVGCPSCDRAVCP